MTRQIISGVMTFFMSIFVMICLNKITPKKLTLYDEPNAKFECNHDKAPSASIYEAKYFAIMNRISELEDNMMALSAKKPEMPPEKEELLNFALSKIDVLQLELTTTRKDLGDSLHRQQELLAYIEKQKRKSKKGFLSCFLPKK